MPPLAAACLPALQPPADNSGPVFVLTAKTFNDTVFKGDRDFFIEFYAPWWWVLACTSCKHGLSASAVGGTLRDPAAWRAPWWLMSKLFWFQAWACHLKRCLSSCHPTPTPTHTHTHSHTRTPIPIPAPYPCSGHCQKLAPAFEAVGKKLQVSLPVALLGAKDPSHGLLTECWHARRHVYWPLAKHLQLQGCSTHTAANLKHDGAHMLRTGCSTVLPPDWPACCLVSPAWHWHSRCHCRRQTMTAWCLPSLTPLPMTRRHTPSWPCTATPPSTL